MLFTNEDDLLKPLTRAHWNNFLNQILKKFVKENDLPTQFTTHSFRPNYITTLWKDSKDILYVTQSIGHSSVALTEHYIQKYTESEMLQLANKRQNL